MRINGAVSGMDTDAIVQNMMKAERLKVDRIEQKRQISEWKREDYNAVNKDMASFIINAKQELGLGRLSGGSFFPTSYTRLDYVKKATVSSETVATATTTANAMDGAFALEVTKLAEAAQKSVKVEQGETLGNSVTMKLKVNGGEEKTITVNAKAGEEVSFEALAKAINDKGIGVKASYAKDSTGAGAFTIVSDTLGSKSSIEVTEVSSTGGNIASFAEKLTLGGAANGVDAKVKFNGVEMTYDSNNIEINGVNINLKAEGKVNINVATNTDEIVNRIKKFVDDYNALIDKLGKKTQEKPNKGFHPLSAEEKKGLKDDEVKDWMEKARAGHLYKDSTINKTLSNIRLSLYENYGEGGSNAFNHITDIGITTARYEKGQAGGKLQINEDKLREAIEKDPNAVMDLLFADGRKAEDGEVYNGKTYKKGEMINGTTGVFTRIFEGLKTGIKDVLTIAGPGNDGALLRQVDSLMLTDFVTKGGKKGIGGISDLEGDILDFKRKIDDMNDLLLKRENQYYDRFAKLETQLQKMQSQSSWVGSQLGQ